MNNDLLNILSNSNKDIDNQKLMDYLSGKLSAEKTHEIEKQMTDSDFVNDAVEGLQEIKNKTNIDAGKKFLAENKKKPNVKVTPSGLQYEVITMGQGKKPTRKDKVSCNYTGSFIDGTEFNNSYTMGGPVTFSVSGVIKGWTEALQMMPVGSKWKLYVPYTLAYGPGQYQTIPGGSALVFEIDLLSIVDK